STRPSTTHWGSASRPWTSPSASCAGDSMAHLPPHCCDASRRARGNELVRNTQAMVPEPTDDPEPDEETDDEPDEEPDDEPDAEIDDEPEPGTLSFGSNSR